ncbi:RsmD family RNA methyltransferase [Flaviflexus huanghaiensis]|uniref:RsmD family RNA methyltransferase n=1 Tax=Flaviflexus huanghaiensis TaxID=1111473 RepID=UPI0015FB26B4|nr:RsmD family RNA methyltransferase [Flaviflexus huanghaiensis]
MVRIVAGTAKGMTIRVPKSARPTPDLVREAIFSTLGHRGYLDETDVLDLFAGSGAFGLEAASRGARSVTAVDAGREAATIIASNARKAGLDVHVVQSKVRTFLDSSATRYDVIFLDPPYAMTNSEIAPVLEAAVPHLVDDGILLLERDKHAGEPSWPEGIEVDDRRSWGDTVIWTALHADYRRNLRA